MKLTASMMVTLELVDSRSTKSGVMLQTYRPNGRATFGRADE